MHRIREVDGHDDEVADTLADLHRLTFFDSAPVPAFDWGHWWLAFYERLPVKHCGHGQLRLMRTMETRARRIGWESILSDTTDNLASANTFIKAGYRLYQPHFPWGWPNTLYWRKSIGDKDRIFQ
jgi:hypothetical protein